MFFPPQVTGRTHRSDISVYINEPFKGVIFREIWKIKNLVKEILDLIKKVIMCGYGSLTVTYMWMMLLG